VIKSRWVSWPGHVVGPTWKTAENVPNFGRQDQEKNNDYENCLENGNRCYKGIGWRDVGWINVTRDRCCCDLLVLRMLPVLWLNDYRNCNLFKFILEWVLKKCIFCSLSLRDYTLILSVGVSAETLDVYQFRNHCS
jgi:hypothetical protein